MGRWEGMEQDFFPIANTIDAFRRFFASRQTLLSLLIEIIKSKVKIFLTDKIGRLNNNYLQLKYELRA
jgi:hypothetical protein